MSLKSEVIGSATLLAYYAVSDMEDELPITKEERASIALHGEATRFLESIDGNIVSPYVRNIAYNEDMLIELIDMYFKHVSCRFPTEHVVLAKKYYEQARDKYQLEN